MSSRKHKPMKPKFAVLVGGSGTLANAMFEAGCPITLMVADQPCKAVDEVAPRHGVEAVVVDRKDFGFGQGKGKFDRVKFSHEVVNVLIEHDIDGVILAGFDTILDAAFFTDHAYGGRTLNSHPALLPAYKGVAHAVPNQIKDGVKVSGTTIHVASADVDGEPYLRQEKVEVLPSDTADTLHERIKIVERRIYVEVIWMWSNLLSADPDFRWPVKEAA